ncbi:MAG: 30S ribosomal protein S4 [Sulfolobales archaeon]|nr:30S ribosomal protein S4 [Sulfolobales archaeon]MCX8186810.1 30S ribosomal protein S4 [Sulfolobales archaeon]MDW7969857.1 30S ribosomal protein S4 [Sulfolobales archaeon]
MGDPRKPRKKWERPGHPWIKDRLARELELIGKYGLRNKREIWVAQTVLRELRGKAKALLSLPPDVRVVKEKQLISKVYTMGLLESENSVLEDILGLDVEHLLERRLQTIVFKKGLAKSVYHARQLVVHGHIAIGSRRVTSPGYLVPRSEENLITLVSKIPQVAVRG